MVVKPHVLRDLGVVLSSTMVAIGFVERALLVETGRSSAGNWSWGYLIAVKLLFVFSAAASNSHETMAMVADLHPGSTPGVGLAVCHATDERLRLLPVAGSRRATVGDSRTVVAIEDMRADVGSVRPRLRRDRQRSRWSAPGARPARVRLVPDASLPLECLVVILLSVACITIVSELLGTVGLFHVVPLTMRSRSSVSPRHGLRPRHQLLDRSITERASTG